MNKLLFLGFCILNASSSFLLAEPNQPPLTESELLTVERICVRLIGKDHKQFEKLIREVRPYAASTSDFDEAPMVCSAGCTYTVALRGNLWLHVGSNNISPKDPAYSKEANAISDAAIYRGRAPNPSNDWDIRDRARPTIFAVEKNRDNDALLSVYAPPKDVLKRLLSPVVPPLN